MTFLLPVSETYFSKDPRAFYWTITLEIKVWMLGLLIAPGAVLFLCYHNEKNTYVFASLFLYTSVTICVYNHLYVY